MKIVSALRIAATLAHWSVLTPPAAACGAFALALAAPAAHADDPKGCAAYLRGDYATALQLFLPEARAGSASAQVAVGWLYDHALGVPHDDAEAVKWYLLAAKQGDARAQQYLGTMYAEGTGLAQDLKEAEHWFRLAAEQGSSGGQYGLGVLYRDGLVVTKDPVEAFKWFSLAVRSGGQTADGTRALAARNALAALLTRDERDRAEAAVSAWRPVQARQTPKLCN